MHEPTSALDVSIQQQVLALLWYIYPEHACKLSYLLISRTTWRLCGPSRIA